MFDLRETREAYVGPMVHEVGAPNHDQIAGMSKARKQMLLQALTSHPANEAFHKPALSD